MITKFNAALKGIELVSCTLLLIALPVFAQSTNLQATIESPQPGAEVIKQLETARQNDWDAALDPSVSPARRGTFLNQMNKADLALKELKHGFSVSPTEIADALWQPPKHITPEQRDQLIAQLEQARQQDDKNEQQMLNQLAWTGSAAPVNTIIFDQRKQQIDTLIEDLRIDAPVHWSAIKQALVVPPAP